MPKADLVLLATIIDHFDPPAICRAQDGTLPWPEGRRQAARGQDARQWSGDHRARSIAPSMYNLKRGPKPGQLFHEKGRGNGYLLKFGDKLVYLSGDTECTPEMRALGTVDLAFVSMNLPYTMPPEEAAECVKAFKPKVVIPYHYRGSDLGVFSRALSDVKGVEVRVREFYAQGQ
jgi:L-ascorbate metabolism protein UlaG (beta-lactamase superfamily)